ncbi:MAG TPA: ABC transporter ATP-binding protein [Ilumatobacteraceae bacterium]|nr:ABC transporter ATP-binding protein [Ilumatobacteraceae bacterium]
MGRPETIDAPADVSPQVVLRVDQLQAGYGRKQVVFDVDLTVREGEIVGVLGHNGSGKTTTIRTILGLNPVIGGRIEFKGRDATRSSSRNNVKAGMAMIPSERFVFADLSVDDNLLLGAANDPDPERRARRLQLVRDLFPILVERAGQSAGTMSGGQQRMVSLGTALMASPTLLMLDEPSLGLAPAVVHQIFDTVRRLADEEGLAVLLLEQNVGQALRIVDRVYVMRSGRVILEESADEMRNRDSYWELF